MRHFLVAVVVALLEASGSSTRAADTISQCPSAAAEERIAETADVVGQAAAWQAAADTTLSGIPVRAIVSGFAMGFAQGALLGVITGLAGAAVITTAPAWVIAAVAIVGVAAASYGAYRIVTSWGGLDAYERSSAIGGIVGGVVGGGIGNAAYPRVATAARALLGRTAVRRRAPAVVTEGGEASFKRHWVGPPRPGDAQAAAALQQWARGGSRQGLSARQIELLELAGQQKVRVEIGNTGVTSPYERVVYIERGLSPEAQHKQLLHELAHRVHHKNYLLTQEPDAIFLREVDANLFEGKTLDEALEHTLKAYGQPLGLPRRYVSSPEALAHWRAELVASAKINSVAMRDFRMIASALGL